MSESTVDVETRLLPRMITESGVAHGPEACADTPVVTVRKAIGRTSRRSMAYKIHTKRRNAPLGHSAVSNTRARRTGQVVVLLRTLNSSFDPSADTST